MVLIEQKSRLDSRVATIPVQGSPRNGEKLKPQRVGTSREITTNIPKTKELDTEAHETINARSAQVAGILLARLFSPLDEVIATHVTQLQEAGMFGQIAHDEHYRQAFNLAFRALQEEVPTTIAPDPEAYTRLLSQTLDRSIHEGQEIDEERVDALLEAGHEKSVEIVTAFFVPYSDKPLASGELPLLHMSDPLVALLEATNSTRFEKSQEKLDSDEAWVTRMRNIAETVVHMTALPDDAQELRQQFFDAQYIGAITEETLNEQPSGVLLERRRKLSKTFTQELKTIRKQYPTVDPHNLVLTLAQALDPSIQGIAIEGKLPKSDQITSKDFQFVITVLAHAVEIESRSKKGTLSPQEEAIIRLAKDIHERFGTYIVNVSDNEKGAFHFDPRQRPGAAPGVDPCPVHTPQADKQLSETLQQAKQLSRLERKRPINSPIRPYHRRLIGGVLPQSPQGKPQDAISFDSRAPEVKAEDTRIQAPLLQSDRGSSRNVPDALLATSPPAKPRSEREEVVPLAKPKILRVSQVASDDSDVLATAHVITSDAGTADMVVQLHTSTNLRSGLGTKRIHFDHEDSHRPQGSHRADQRPSGVIGSVDPAQTVRLVTGSGADTLVSGIVDRGTADRGQVGLSGSRNPTTRDSDSRGTGGNISERREGTSNPREPRSTITRDSAVATRQTSMRQEMRDKETGETLAERLAEAERLQTIEESDRAIEEIGHTARSTAPEGTQKANTTIRLSTGNLLSETDDLETVVATERGLGRERHKATQTSIGVNYDARSVAALEPQDTESSEETSQIIPALGVQQVGPGTYEERQIPVTQGSRIIPQRIDTSQVKIPAHALAMPLNHTLPSLALSLEVNDDSTLSPDTSRVGDQIRQALALAAA